MKSIRPPVFNPLLLTLVEQANAEAWTPEQGLDAGLWALMRKAADERDTPPNWTRWVRAWPVVTRESWRAVLTQSPSWQSGAGDIVDHEVQGLPGEPAWEAAIQAKEKGARVWWAVPASTRPAWAMGHAHKLGWALRLLPEPAGTPAAQNHAAQVALWGSEILRRPDWSQWVSPWADWMSCSLREAMGAKVVGRREAGQTEAMRRLWAQAQQEHGGRGAWEEIVVALALHDRARILGAPCPIPKS